MIVARRLLPLSLAVGVALVASADILRARQGSQALRHFGHVATGFNGAPGGRGLTVTMAMEVSMAMLHANFAAGHRDDLARMKTHAGHVLHALIPGEGGKGTGLGFGVKRAAEMVVTHIEMAVNASDASEAMKTLGPTVALAARAVAARAQAMADLVARVAAAQTAAEAAPLVSELRTMALELDTGRDVNASGRVDFDATEPGMNQLEAQVYGILEREKLPRILK